MCHLFTVLKQTVAVVSAKWAQNQWNGGCNKKTVVATTVRAKAKTREATMIL